MSVPAVKNEGTDLEVTINKFTDEIKNMTPSLATLLKNKHPYVLNNLTAILVTMGLSDPRKSVTASVQNNTMFKGTLLSIKEKGNTVAAPGVAETTKSKMGM